MVVSAGIAPLEIRFDAPATVRDALATMGRTEDVRFAPSGRRLAVACYAREQIAVAEIEITVTASGPKIAVSSLDQLAATELHEPHGVDFVDDDRLIVANRAGGVAVFRLPQPGTAGEMTRIAPADGDVPGPLDSPGSVAVHSFGAGHEVLVCHNWANTVTRHMLDADGMLAAGEVVVRKWLDLPDGVAISRDGRWLAVSNHNSHSVLIYDRSNLNAQADPVGILRGVHYPHGLRFAADDRRLLVADAGAPHIRVFVSSEGDWHGVGYPTATIQVMDDHTFALGRHDPQEGGPKGIDVDPRTNVLVVTSERLPLAFFDLTTALGRSIPGPTHDALVRYELHVLEEKDRIKAAASEARAELRELRQTKAWRLTKPARSTHEAVLRLRARRRSRRA